MPPALRRRVRRPPRPAKSAAAASHPHEIHGQFQRIAAAFGLDFIGAFLEVVAGNGPAVFPEQRANVQHAAAAAVQVGLVMTGEFLHAVAEVHQAEVAGPDEATAGGHDQLAAAFEHVDAHVVQVGAGDCLGAAHADVVGGVGAVAAGAVSAKKIIPAVAIDQVGGFAVDGDVDGLVAFDVLARLGIEFDEPDEAEVGSVGEPQPAIGGIEQERRDQWHRSPRCRQIEATTMVVIPCDSRGNWGRASCSTSRESCWRVLRPDRRRTRHRPCSNDRRCG